MSELIGPTDSECGVDERVDVGTRIGATLIALSDAGTRGTISPLGPPLRVDPACRGPTPEPPQLGPHRRTRRSAFADVIASAGAPSMSTPLVSSSTAPLGSPSVSKSPSRSSASPVWIPIRTRSTGPPAQSSAASPRCAVIAASTADGSSGEHDAVAVTTGGEDVAPCVFDGGVQDLVVACQRRRPPCRAGNPTGCRAFDVGEQERHRAGRRWWSPPSIRGLWWQGLWRGAPPGSSGRQGHPGIVVAGHGREPLFGPLGLGLLDPFAVAVHEVPPDEPSSTGSPPRSIARPVPVSTGRLPLSSTASWPDASGVPPRRRSPSIASTPRSGCVASMVIERSPRWVAVRRAPVGNSRPPATPSTTRYRRPGAHHPSPGCRWPQCSRTRHRRFRDRVGAQPRSAGRASVARSRDRRGGCARCGPRPAPAVIQLAAPGSIVDTAPVESRWTMRPSNR